MLLPLNLLSEDIELFFGIFAVLQTSIELEGDLQVRYCKINEVVDKRVLDLELGDDSCKATRLQNPQKAGLPD